VRVVDDSGEELLAAWWEEIEALPSGWLASHSSMGEGEQTIVKRWQRSHDSLDSGIEIRKLKVQE